MQQCKASSYTKYHVGRIQLLPPLQGQVLNQTSAWWMQHTAHITPNALLAVPDPNVAIMKKCQVLPIEFVVRGFMTGASLMLHA
jgi:phosphoribosylaminoimidazole-succinocarboxamide synthase